MQQRQDIITRMLITWSGVNSDGGCRRLQPGPTGGLTAQLSQVAWSEGLRPLGAVLHSP